MYLNFSNEKKWPMMLLKVKYFQILKHIKKIWRTKWIIFTRILWDKNHNLKLKFYHKIYQNKYKLKERSTKCYSQNKFCKNLDATYTSKTCRNLLKFSKRDSTNCLFIVSSELNFRKACNDLLESVQGWVKYSWNQKQ